jgi:hypothetical protein
MDNVNLAFRKLENYEIIYPFICKLIANLMVCWGCDRIVVLRFFWELRSPELAVKLKQPIFFVLKGDQLS